MIEKKNESIGGSPEKTRKIFMEPSPNKKSQNLLNSLKVKLNPEHIDYKRYKQQQERSLKVFEDYDEGH